MATGKTDHDRERRIEMEIVVDAHDESERAMGWYSYLDDSVHFPFTARCCVQRPISPLRVGDEVEVIGLGPEDECEHAMFVRIRWDRKEGLAVPLAQLKVAHADEATRTAVEDWHYWLKKGYEF
jgi:hypothetical protein